MLSGVLLVSGLARADSFNVAISSSALGVNTTGTLVGTGNNDGSFTITSISGTGITGLIAAGDAFFGNDNLLFPTQSRFFDVNGIAFTGIFGGKSLSLNLFSTVSGFEALGFDDAGNFYDESATASLAPAAVTPEPSSMLLSGTGLLAIAVFLFRKRFPSLAA